ncbi:nitrite reductase small subunit NirD [Alteromonadaceae bacterium M269]|nr:nitrite reductase small subunit NirD [Alteromonadaceae bacterium M269]
MQWTTICSKDDLVKNAGVCAKYGDQQVALFLCSDGQGEEVYAIDNWDPVGQANVLSRGLIGTVNDTLVVASPLYKQHICLKTGACLENVNSNVNAYSARIEGNHIQISSSAPA